MNTCPITVQPGQIVGFRQARRHERPGRLYPIFAIAGASPDGDGGEGQQTGQSDGQGSGDNGSQGSGSGQQNDTGSGQSDGQSSGQQADAFKDWDGKVETLPADVQRMIRDARKEAQDMRAGKNAETDRVNAILKAAGIKTDEDDPTKLLETERQERERLAEENREIKRERAAEKAGRKHGADVDELLDKRSFLTELKKLDPSKDTFQTELDALVAKTLKDNPKLKATQAATSSSVDHSGGTGERRTNQPKSLADAVASSYGT